MKILKKISKLFIKLPSFLLLTLLYFYRGVISPMFPRCCRFTPSCSQYSIESIKKHGAIKGIILTIKRLSKCHPLGGRGYDPVPATFSFKKTCNHDK